MPHSRQTHPEYAEDTIIVRSLGLRLPHNHRIEAHTHPWHQLIYATEGVMSVNTATGTWVVPPYRAVWIPAGFEHQVRTTGTVRMRTLYLRPRRTRPLPNACCVVHVTPLLRELILETMRLAMLLNTVPEQRRLADVLFDQIVHTREAPLRITLPSDPRARRVAEKARADLSTSRPLSEYTKDCGASARTIERLFLTETGTTFGRWLQRVKALHAIEQLAAGASVTNAGLAVGYHSTSAFILMFKRIHGVTPGNYFADQQENVVGSAFLRP